MAPDHTRSARGGDQLRLAATTINGDPWCAGPNCREGRSLPEQFFHQRSFQHHAFGSHTNTNRNTNGNCYWNTDRNADTECYTDSDGYSYGDTDDYTKAHAHAKARTDAKASSVTAAETVSGSLPLSDGRLLHGRNSGRRTQFV
jgi:hypothetical protein